MAQSLRSGLATGSGPRDFIIGTRVFQGRLFRLVLKLFELEDSCLFHHVGVELSHQTLEVLLCDNIIRKEEEIQSLQGVLAPHGTKPHTNSSRTVLI